MSICVSLVFTSLRDTLEKHDFTATSPAGYQWLRKALHPAEPTIKAARCPSKGIRPTATQEAVITFIVKAPETLQMPHWGFRMSMKNDPLCPLGVEVDGMAAQTVLNTAYYSGTPFTAHTPNDYMEAANKFRAACEQYRVTALSVTGYFVGATMTDQGSILAAQCSDAAFESAASRVKSGSGHNSKVIGFGQALPGTTAITAGTNLYTAPAREGFYMPYKMENPEKWLSTDDLASIRRYGQGLNFAGTTDLHDFTIGYPFGNIIQEDASYNKFTTLWNPPGDDGLGMIYVDGLAQTTSFRCTVRIAIEAMTRPVSTLATFCEPPALPDEHAIRMYTEIASRLKDAYPAKDNSLGTLWQKVKQIASSIWRTVSPALSYIPQIAPIVSGINTAGELIRKARDKGAPNVSRGARSRRRRRAPRNRRNGPRRLYGGRYGRRRVYFNRKPKQPSSQGNQQPQQKDAKSTVVITDSGVRIVRPNKSVGTSQ